MSNYGDNIYQSPPISSIDGVVRDKSILDMATVIHAGFENVGDIVGDLHGHSSDQSTGARFINTIASAIGDATTLSQEEPYGVEFNSYTNSYTNDLETKDFILDLVPHEYADSVNIGVSSDEDKNIAWSRKFNYSELKAPGDFCIQGRVLTFYKVPDGQFSVVYSGTYPSLYSGKDGYRPNVYPGISLIDKGLVDRPSISLKDSGRYRIKFQKTRLNSEGKEFSRLLDLSFSEDISKYVDPVGAKECPSELASVWIKSGNSYEKLDTRSIYILSSDEIEIDTDEDIDPSKDTLVLALSNRTISEVVSELYSLLTNHSHNRQDLSSPIPHGQLMGLIPPSDKEGVSYGGSSMPGNEHPQYLHREGYRDNDSGTYNNALIGDLLISSTSDKSLFNNIEKDSNRLIFGSTTEGASFRYRSAEKDLLLHSVNNGLNIKTNPDKEGGSVALTVDEHKVYSKMSDMLISPKSGILKVVDTDDDSKLVKIAARDLDIENINVTGRAFFESGSSMSFNGLDMKVDANGVEFLTDDESKIVTISSKAFFKDFEASRASIGLQVVDGSDKIQFGDSGKEYFHYSPTSDRASFTGSNPLMFTSTGRHTGISIGPKESYFNMYSSTPEGGSSTITDHDTYVETKTGDVHFIRSTYEDQPYQDKVYSWKQTSADKERVDDLRKWPHSNIFANDGTFKSIYLNTSSLKERRGVSFGELNHIYVTGSGTDCPSGWMVLESQNGVVLTESQSDPLDCTSISYADLTAGDIQSFGSILSEGDLGAGGNLTVSGEASVNNLTVKEEVNVDGAARFGDQVIMEDVSVHLADSQFNSNLIVKGSASVANELKVSNIVATGLSKFSESVEMSSNLSIDKDLKVEGSTLLLGRADVDGRLTSSEISTGPLYAAKADIQGTIYTTGGIESKGPAAMLGGMSVKGATLFESDVTCTKSITAAAFYLSDSASISKDISVDGEARFKSDVILGSDTSKVDVLSDANLFGSKTTVAGSLVAQSDTEMKGKLKTSSEVEVGSNIKVGGSSNISANLDVGGESTLKNTKVAGSLSVTQGVNSSGLSQFNEVVVKESVMVDGDMSCGSLSSVGGIKSDKGSQSSLGSLDVLNGMSVSNGATISGNTRIYGDTESSGNQSIGGKLTVSSEIKSDADINSGGSISAAANLSVSGNSSLKNLSATGSASIDGSLSVVGLSQLGTATLSGDASIEGKVSSKSVTVSEGLFAAKGSTSSLDNLEVIGTLNVAGDTSISGEEINIYGELSVSGDHNVGGKIVSKAGMSASGDISSTGKISGGTIAIEGESKFGSVTASGAMNVQSTLSTSGLLRVGSGANLIQADPASGQVKGKTGLFTDQFTVGTVVANGDGYSKFKNVELSGIINQVVGNSSNFLTNSTINALSVTKGAEVRGDLVVKSSVRDTTLSSGKITTKDIVADSIGIQDINAPTASRAVHVPDSLAEGSPSLAGQFRQGKFISQGRTYFKDPVFMEDDSAITGKFFVNEIVRLNPDLDADGNALDHINIVAKECYYAP